jgi:hypothetical protein
MNNNLCTALIIKDCIKEPKMIDLYIRLSKESRICDKNTNIITIKKRNNNLCIALIILIIWHYLRLYVSH